MLEFSPKPLRSEAKYSSEKSSSKLLGLDIRKARARYLERFSPPQKSCRIGCSWLLHSREAIECGLSAVMRVKELPESQLDNCFNWDQIKCKLLSLVWVSLAHTPSLGTTRLGKKMKAAPSINHSGVERCVQSRFFVGPALLSKICPTRKDVFTLFLVSLTDSAVLISRKMAAWWRRFLKRRFLNF